MMSPGLAIPGRNGTPLAIAALPSGSVSPGDTMNRDPASIAWPSMALLSTVPAPTTAPETSAIAFNATSAPGVRSVTSITGNPASTNVSASATGSIEPSITSTGMTGAIRMISSMVMDTPGRMPRQHRKGPAADG